MEEIKWEARNLFGNWIIFDEKDNVLNIRENEGVAKLISSAPDMLKVLKSIKRLRPIIEWNKGEDNEEMWNGEYEAISNMFNEIDVVIKKASEINPLKTTDKF